MIKNNKIIDKLLDELGKTGNVCIASTKAGISHATFYRWYKEDPDLHEHIDNAISIGRENMNSFVESKLIQNITNNIQRAIEFYLKFHDKQYKQVPSSDYGQHENSKKPPIALVEFVGEDMPDFHKESESSSNYIETGYSCDKI